jgi:Flp pilus assembly pilin Flp
MTVLIGAAREFNKDETGASMAEYGLLLALISAVCLAAMSALGTSLSSVMNAVASSV